MPTPKHEPDAQGPEAGEFSAIVPDNPTPMIPPQEEGRDRPDTSSDPDDLYGVKKKEAVEINTEHADADAKVADAEGATAGAHAATASEEEYEYDDSEDDAEEEEEETATEKVTHTAPANVKKKKKKKAGHKG